MWAELINSIKTFGGKYFLPIWSILPGSISMNSLCVRSKLRASSAEQMEASRGKLGGVQTWGNWGGWAKEKLWMCVLSGEWFSAEGPMEASREVRKGFLENLPLSPPEKS